MLTRGPFGQSLSTITAVTGNVEQSKPDSHFDSQIDPYILCILIESIHRGEHSTRSLGRPSTYQVQMSDTYTK